MVSPEDVRVSAILVAAGIGSRFSVGEEDIAKQFVRLAGRPLYQWPLKALAEHHSVERIVIVTLEAMVAKLEVESRALALAIEIDVIAGGASRQESVWCALSHLADREPAPEFVLIHDAARPFLTASILDETIGAMAQYGACTTAIPVADTIKRVREGFVVQTVRREDLVLVQTPQAGRLAWLTEAHQQARSKGSEHTDDAAVLEAAGYPVAVVSGSPYNLKLTRPEDLFVAQALVQALNQGESGA